MRAWEATAASVARLSSSDFESLWVATPDTDGRKALLRARFRWDVEAFCRWCWPDRFNLPFNSFHRALFDEALERPAWDDPDRARRPGVHSAVAAPRGYAKSTIGSFALVMHKIVYGLEAFVLLISHELGLANDLSNDLRSALEQEDSPLAELYGPFEIEGGVTSWRVKVAGAPSVGVLPRSVKSAVRGRKHPTRGIRPTLVVLDDAEDKDKVRVAARRRELWSFLNSDVLKVGSRTGGTDIWVRGTVLHPDAMLARLLEEPGWRGQKWKAIEQWPVRADLWERCGAIYKDLALGPRRAKLARAYYEARKAEMDRGSRLLDPESDSLYALYEQIWVGGLAAFLRERQNDPVDPSASLFLPERFSRFKLRESSLVVNGVPRQVKLADLRLKAYWDPTMGGPEADFGALVVLGRDSHGYAYVLDVVLTRQPVSGQLEHVWRLAERWQLREFGYESNGFQELAEQTWPQQRERRKAAGAYWQVELVGSKTHEPKEARIASMQADIENGWLLFADHLPSEYFNQFAQFPSGANDDGPDATQKVWSQSGGRPIGMETGQSHWPWRQA